jgi:hypothetical protein
MLGVGVGVGLGVGVPRGYICMYCRGGWGNLRALPGWAEVGSAVTCNVGPGCSGSLVHRYILGVGCVMRRVDLSVLSTVYCTYIHTFIDYRPVVSDFHLIAPHCIAPHIVPVPASHPPPAVRMMCRERVCERKREVL